MTDEENPVSQHLAPGVIPTLLQSEFLVSESNSQYSAGFSGVGSYKSGPCFDLTLSKDSK